METQDRNLNPFWLQFVNFDNLLLSWGSLFFTHGSLCSRIWESLVSVLITGLWPGSFVYKNFTSMHYTPSFTSWFVKHRCFWLNWRPHTFDTLPWITGSTKKQRSQSNSTHPPPKVTAPWKWWFNFWKTLRTPERNGPPWKKQSCVKHENCEDASI